ncbi:MAG TPA: hypothetical protein VMS14_07835, partial [Ilumatobacteraceae bacterium]|nr:hypothetical protein [Ilumatobacteraceae bacterium]
VEYARRRREVASRLADAGVEVTGTDGINLWMRVDNQRSALLTLAAQGIGVAPGDPFMVRDDAPHVRVTVGLIDHDLDGIARRLADAAGVARRASHR